MDVDPEIANDRMADLESNFLVMQEQVGSAGQLNEAWDKEKTSLLEEIAKKDAIIKKREGEVKKLNLTIDEIEENLAEVFSEKNQLQERVNNLESIKTRKEMLPDTDQLHLSEELDSVHRGLQQLASSLETGRCPACCQFPSMQREGATIHPNIMESLNQQRSSPSKIINGNSSELRDLSLESTLDNERNRLVTGASELKVLLDESNAENAKLREELQRVTTESLGLSNELRQALQVVITERNAIQATVSDQKRIEAQLRFSEDQLKVKILELEDALKRAEMRRSEDLQLAMEEQKSLQTTLNDQCALKCQLQCINEQSTTKVKELQTALELAEMHGHQAQERLTACQLELDAATDENIVIETATMGLIKELQDRLDERNASIDMLEQEMTTARGKLQEVADKSTELEQLLESRESELLKKEADMATAQEQLNALGVSSGEAKMELVRRLAELEAILKQTELDKASLMERLAISDLVSDVECREEHSRQALEVELKSSVTNTVHLQCQLANETSDNRNICQELSNSISTRDASINKVAEENAGLKIELDQLRSTIDHLTTLNSELHSKLNHGETTKKEQVTCHTDLPLANIANDDAVKIVKLRIMELESELRVALDDGQRVSQMLESELVEREVILSRESQLEQHLEVVISEKEELVQEMAVVHQRLEEMTGNHVDLERRLEKEIHEVSSRFSELQRLQMQTASRDKETKQEVEAAAARNATTEQLLAVSRDNYKSLKEQSQQKRNVLLERVTELTRLSDRLLERNAKLEGDLATAEASGLVRCEELVATRQRLDEMVESLNAFDKSKQEVSDRMTQLQRLQIQLNTRNAEQKRSIELLEENLLKAQQALVATRSAKASDELDVVFDGNVHLEKMLAATRQALNDRVAGLAAVEKDKEELEQRLKKMERKLEGIDRIEPPQVKSDEQLVALQLEVSTLTEQKKELDNTLEGLREKHVSLIGTLQLMSTNGKRLERAMNGNSQHTSGDAREMKVLQEEKDRTSRLLEEARTNNKMLKIKLVGLSMRLRQQMGENVTPVCVNSCDVDSMEQPCRLTDLDASGGVEHSSVLPAQLSTSVPESDADLDKNTESSNSHKRTKDCQNLPSQKRVCSQNKCMPPRKRDV